MGRAGGEQGSVASERSKRVNTSESRLYAALGMRGALQKAGLHAGLLRVVGAVQGVVREIEKPYMLKRKKRSMWVLYPTFGIASAMANLNATAVRSSVMMVFTRSRRLPSSYYTFNRTQGHRGYIGGRGYGHGYGSTGRKTVRTGGAQQRRHVLLHLSDECYYC